LKEPPLVKPDANELHPDVNSTDPPLAFHNYLDDFLQAIRVFGFLEKPVSDFINTVSRIRCSPSCKVFHELARHLQTRRLIAGDSLSLDQDRSFYCVIDGMVQVFAQTGQPMAHQKGAWDEEDMNGYQLLNEVGSGGTLSSLFTILSLFTEDVKMSWQDDEPQEDILDDVPDLLSVHTRNRVDSDISQLDLGKDSTAFSPRRSQTFSSSSGSTIHAASDSASPQSRPASHYYDMLETPIAKHQRSLPRTHFHPSSQPHHGVVARATEDATLAVIPAEAFRRLTKKFPKATGHIVQGELPSVCSARPSVNVRK
jgi:lysophospholipid hydrolase